MNAKKVYSLTTLIVQQFKSRNSILKFLTFKKKLNDSIRHEQEYVNKQYLCTSLGLFEKSRIVPSSR